MNPAETKHKHKLELTTPNDREIVATRTFHASREIVFDAFTKRELIQRWLLGADGWSMPVCDVDLRPGGTFHHVWRNDANGTEFGLGGTYCEIVRPERILHVERFDGPMDSGEALITTTFVEQNGWTAFTMTMSFQSREVRDMAIESGIERGMARSYDRLSDLLARE
jgi:uncharacterized protein YndB with AHSA1/START domain